MNHIFYLIFFPRSFILLFTASIQSRQLGLTIVPWLFSNISLKVWHMDMLSKDFHMIACYVSLAIFYTCNQCNYDVSGPHDLRHQAGVDMRNTREINKYEAWKMLGKTSKYSATIHQLLQQWVVHGKLSLKISWTGAGRRMDSAVRGFLPRDKHGEN